MQWFEWLCHTNFSFLMGASHPQDFVINAHKFQYQGLGICDYDGVYGIVKAHQALKDIVRTGQPPIQLAYGSEVHLENDHHLPIILQNTLVLVAMNHHGYYELCKLLTLSHKHGKKDPKVTIEDITAADTSHLICLQPMRGLIRQGKFSHLEKRFQLLKQVFGERFSAVVSYHLNPSEDCWIPYTLALAQKTGVKVILSQDPYFVSQEDKQLSDIVQAMRLNKPVYEIPSYLFPNRQRCLLPLPILEKRYRRFSSFQEYQKSSLALAQMIHFNLDELRYQYPQEMIPTGYTSLTYLEKLVWEGASKRYDSHIPTQIADLLYKELELIKTLEFADYFLTVWDIVSWAKKNAILCQGRGSAANSAICFVLGITQADPTLFDLLFERFISLERGDPPDIDVDFEHERREEVIQYIYQRYGRQRAAMVANVVRFRRRGAIRFVGKALGVSEAIIHQTTQLQKMRFYRHHTQEAWQEIAATATGNALTPSLLDLWHTNAEKIIGFPRHMGIHSGGFVLTHKPVDWLVAQEPATMPGRTVIQWAKDDIESLSFFKIDILALGMLTALRKAFELIASKHQTHLTLATIPQDDRKTYEMIEKADTVGTFQIESRAQMSMLPRLRPRAFYDLVIQVGIIRPGPIQGGLIHPYLNRRFGREAITYPHPDLIPILKRTLGVPIFQEQVMRIAMAIGNFTPGEADDLRKQIGSWGINKNLNTMIVRLEEGMRLNGIEEQYINQIIGHFQGFADYGFPESHAISFALLAYASSYIKCHYPDAFYTALLNSQPMGFYSRHALIQSARREGVAVKPVCIKNSDWYTKLELEDSPGNTGKNYALRLGFHFVRGLTRNNTEVMLEQRQNDHWNELIDFLKTSPFHRGDLTALAAANAFHTFGLDRRSSIWLAEAAPFAPCVEQLDAIPHLPEEEPLTTIQQDFHATSTTLGDHPCTIIKQHYWSYPVSQESLTTSKKLASLIPNQVISVFGMVLVRQSPATAKGMVFFTLEDEAGFINLVFTPQKYSEYRNIINRHGFICAKGKLQKSFRRSFHHD